MFIARLWLLNFWQLGLEFCCKENFTLSADVVPVGDEYERVYLNEIAATCMKTTTNVAAGWNLAAVAA